MSSINFDNPWLLLLAVPLVALFVVPFAIAIRKDNVNAHNVASGVIHIIMALIIAFVAAGTSVVTSVTQTDVYVVADVSYSANKNLDVIDGYIRELGKNLPDNSRMGVVCFGKNAKLLNRLGERPSSVKTSDVDDSATDIVNALDFTASLFREDVIKRIVLITDGKQTNESDPNALKRQADALMDRNIHIDAIYVDDNISPSAREVQISGVNYTQTACINRTERAEVVVNCSCPQFRYENGESVPYETDAKLSLYRTTESGEELLREEWARLTLGANNVYFTLPTDKAGTFEYRVEISAEEDENTRNNQTSFTQVVSDNFKTLLIANGSADRDAVSAYYRQVYGENEYDEQGNLVKGIKAFGFVGDREIPTSVEEMCLYDEIILSNVNAVEVQNYELFLQSLDTVVSMFGKSLVTLGNTHIQDYPTGELKVLSDMLPVKYGKSNSDPQLYTFIFDTSRSMELYDKLARAKAAALRLLGTIGDDDRLSIVEFNGDFSSQFYPAAQVGPNRERIENYIKGLKVKQNTDIGGGLSTAYSQMGGSGYSKKRALLFTDGLDMGGSDLRSVVTDMRDDEIYLSVFDVGRPDYNSSSVIAQKDLLIELGATGGDKCYSITTDAEVANLDLSELPTGADKKGGNSFINVKQRGDEVLKGISNGTPGNANLLDGNFVGGYYYSQAKASATNVLTVNDLNVTAVDRQAEAPLYSYWNYGSGKVSVYTSTVSGDWARGLKGDVPGLLFGNIITTNAPSQKTEYPFLLDITAEEGYANIVLTPERVSPDARATVEITAPDGRTVRGSLAFGTNTFDYTFVTSQLGTYTIRIGYEHRGRSFVAERVLDLAYSAEYDSFALYDAAVLHKMLGGNGKVSEDGRLVIENDPDEVGIYNLSLSIPLLITCVVLYAVDIAVRKLKWEDIKSLFKRGRKVK